MKIFAESANESVKKKKKKTNQNRQRSVTHTTLPP